MPRITYYSFHFLFPFFVHVCNLVNLFVISTKERDKRRGRKRREVSLAVRQRRSGAMGGCQGSLRSAEACRGLRRSSVMRNSRSIGDCRSFRSGICRRSFKFNFGYGVFFFFPLWVLTSQISGFSFSDLVLVIFYFFFFFLSFRSGFGFFFFLSFRFVLRYELHILFAKM